MADKKIYKFELLAGTHTENGMPGTGADGTPCKTDVNYKRGDIIITDIDLHKKFDQPGMPPKFKRVASSTPHTKKEFCRFTNTGTALTVAGFNDGPRNEVIADDETEDLDEELAEEEADDDGEEGTKDPMPSESTLNHMTKDEIISFAKNLEIDLKGCTTKAEMVTRINEYTAGEDAKG